MPNFYENSIADAIAYLEKTPNEDNLQIRRGLKVVGQYIKSTPIEAQNHIAAKSSLSQDDISFIENIMDRKLVGVYKRIGRWDSRHDAD